MPNWCANYIEIEGNEATIEKALSFVKEDCGEEKFFDFNSLIPMPKEYLGLEAGSREPLAIACYNAKKTKDMNKFAREMKTGYFRYMIEEAAKANGVIAEDVTAQMFYDYMLANHSEYFELGEKYCFCIENFGYKDWYDWCVAIWGTKWNSCRSEFFEESVRFETAWSPVIDLIALWGSLFPSLKFTYYFADEQGAVNTGKVVIENGAVQESSFYDDFSDDAFDCADNAWGYEPGTLKSEYESE